MKIWLTDLTYTQQTISSDVVPAAIGMLAEYTLQELSSHNLDVRVFKYPEDLAVALQSETPDILGLSNYVWNALLSHAFAKVVKENHPETKIVMGGPNFPTIASEQEEVLKSAPWLDYFIMKEGEQALVSLVLLLLEDKNPSIEKLMNVPNLVCLDENKSLHISDKLERVMDLNIIPSPYLSGRLDPFLDGRLLPVIQTNRGCPFTCTFCTEGQNYWSKVSKKSADTISAEIKYISAAMGNLPEDKRRGDLLISDSNFAMFKEDIDTCHTIAKEQEKHGYPTYINVATGKNKKERVLEAAKIVNGAMKLAGSVQSLDEGVQKNIKRSNISADQIVDLALQATEIGANTYSEVILGLPGDSKDAHFKTLEVLVDSEFSTLSMYQLMVLPGTELGLQSTKDEHGMVCKYRVVPRCFGVFDVYDTQIAVAEIEEICIASNTLPYADYLSCRRMNFIVNVFYNDEVFSGLIKILKSLGLSPWGWLRNIYENTSYEQFNNLCALFIEETESELWEDATELRSLTSNAQTVQNYIDGKLGNNLIFKYKALSLTTYFNAVLKIAEDSMVSFLKSTHNNSPHIERLITDVLNYRRCQIEDLFFDQTERCAEFNYDVQGLLNSQTVSSVEGFLLPQAQTLKFSVNEKQLKMINSYIDIFGNELTGLSRILSRVFLKQLMRSCDVESSTAR